MALADWFAYRFIPSRKGQGSELRRALRISTTEAIFAMVHFALTQGIFMTNYIIDLGGSNFVCGVVQALPYLTQSVFFLSPVLVRRFDGRRPVVTGFILCHRLSWILLTALLFVRWSPPVRQVLMILTLLAANACAVVAGNAWLGWMADLVPKGIRGAYYGRRNLYLGITSLLAILIGSQVLNASDYWGDRRIGYVVCFGAAVVAALFSSWFLSRQYEPPRESAADLQWRKLLAEPLQNGQLMRYVRFFVVWMFFLGLSDAFFGVHMVRVLKMSPAQMGLQALIGSTMTLVAARLWARPLDRLGSRAVLLTSGILISFHVWIWFWAQPGILWPVWVTTILGGFCWAGFNLAIFNWPQLMSSPRDRQYALGVVNATSGLTYVVGSVLGGILTTALPQTLFHIGQYEFLHFHLLFAISALGRLFAITVLGTRVVRKSKKAHRSSSDLVFATLRMITGRTLPQLRPVGSSLFPRRNSGRVWGHDVGQTLDTPAAARPEPGSSGEDLVPDPPVA